MKKILIVGLGGIGQRHVRNLVHLLGKDVQFIAYRVRGLQRVVTPQLSIDQGKHVEDEYAITAFSDLAEALAEKPNMALICNPSNQHVAAAQACVSAGCDIFIEKPLSDSVEGVAKLIETVQTEKLVAMVGYQLRFHPCLITLADILHSGNLGTILSVRATIGEYLPNWHPYEDYRTMYASRSDLGGGVILSQIHELDYLYSLFGAPKRLFALGGHWSQLEIDVEDTASILMECEYEGRSLPVHLHQDYLQDPASRQCEIIGDKGRVVADIRNLTVTFYASKCEPEVHSFPQFDRNQLFLDEMAHYLKCVEERRRPLVDLTDGFQSLRIALAAKKSIACGRAVSLDEGRADVREYAV